MWNKIVENWYEICVLLVCLHYREVQIKHRLSLSAFHSKANGNIHFCKTIDVLMPLLKESVNSAAMVRHCMGLIKELIRKVNPEQESSVLTGDQPVYAIGKQVQWVYQDVFAEDVWMMSPLHIEMALICLIGDLFGRDIQPGRV